MKGGVKMNSKITETLENEKRYYHVRPVDFLDLMFYGNKLVRAYNHKLNKEYRGKNLDVFTENYDLFNRYYRQAVTDLAEYRTKAKQMRLDTSRPPSVKRTPSMPEPNGYVCVAGHRIIARAPNMIEARKSAVRYAKTGSAGIEIYRGSEYVGEVHLHYGTAIFETKTYARAVKSDGTLI